LLIIGLSRLHRLREARPLIGISGRMRPLMLAGRWLPSAMYVRSGCSFHVALG
jgi:hypothetical protein